MRLKLLTALILLLGADATAQTFAGSGTYLVGVDIEAGTYRSAVGPDGSCYWERLSGLSGESDEIMANEIVSRGTVLAEIKPSDYAFKTSGCANWRRIDVGTSRIRYGGAADGGGEQREVCVQFTGLVRMDVEEAETALENGTAFEPYVYPCKRLTVCARTAWADEMEDRCLQSRERNYPVKDVTQIRLEIIRDSRRAYEESGGVCGCPYNRDRSDERCGVASLYASRAAESPLCYPSDVTEAMLDEHRTANPRIWETVRPPYPADPPK